MIELSVVVGTRNRLEYLKKCLASIFADLALNHEVIVVDAGSSDGTLDYLKNLTQQYSQQLKVIEDGQPIGQAKSLNRVFKTLTSEYTCWLSDDNVVQAQMLSRSLNILKQNPKMGMLGLKVKDILGPGIQKPYNGGIWRSGVMCVDQGMIRTQLLQAIGGFDETYKAYGIDADLTTQVLLRGWQVAFTKAIAIHHLRDHENAPGAFEPQQRIEQRKNSIVIYEKKFKKLCQRPLSIRLRGFINRMLLNGGLKNADLSNTLNARFVSLQELVRPPADDFHLVQKIPDLLLGKLQ